MAGYTFMWINDMKGLPRVSRKVIEVVMEIHKFVRLRQETLTGWHKEQRSVTWKWNKKPKEMQINPWGQIQP